MRLVVAVPAGQGNVVGVFKQKLQRWRFDVAAAKDFIGFAGEFIESLNPDFSEVGHATFEARRQKPYPLSN